MSDAEAACSEPLTRSEGLLTKSYALSPKEMTGPVQSTGAIQNTTPGEITLLNVLTTCKRNKVFFLEAFRIW